MKRLIYILFCILFASTDVSAQILRVHLVKGDKDNETNVYNCLVFYFKNKLELESAYKDVSNKFENVNLQDSRQKYHFDAYDNTDDKGKCELKGYSHTSRGYLLIDARDVLDDQVFTIELSKQNLKEAETGIYEFKYLIKINRGKDGIRETEMQETKVTAQRNTALTTRVRSIVVGKDKKVVINAIIDSAYARNDARFVVNPIIVLPSNNNDTIGRLAPFVVDGEQYEKTMLRRMGGKHEHDKQNKYIGLEIYGRRVTDFGKTEEDTKYFSPIPKMQLRKPNQYQISRWIYDYDFQHQYKLQVHTWYEDYNSVYHQKSDARWLFDVDYNRYLDWSSAQVDADIDPTHYEIRPTSAATPHSEDYKIEFEGTTATLKSDSLTQVEFNRMYSDIDKLYYATDNSYIDSDTIIGYASPEGGYDSNKNLAGRRAAALAARIHERYPGSKLPKPGSEGKVSTWIDVANLLDLQGDSMYTRLASKVRDIVEHHPNNMKAQEAQIRTLDGYKTIIYPHILPKLRRVEFKYCSVSYRELSKEEVYDQYLTNNHYWDDTKHDYEYYYLLPQLYENKKWDDLEKYAQQALEKCEGQDVKKTIATERIILGKTIDAETGDTLVRDSFLTRDVPLHRPYPLAAFYLAKCKLRKHQPDEKLLENYYDYSIGGKIQSPAYVAKDYNGPRFWWNEPAMVLTQIMMLCDAKNYRKAKEVYQYWVDQKKYTKLGIFLEALEGNYNKKNVRDTIAATSPMNYVLAWYAYADLTGDKKGFENALSAINEKITLSSWQGEPLNKEDDRVQYMKALCLYNLKATATQRSDEQGLLPSNFIYEPSYEDDEMDDLCWAAPMLKAIELNPDNLTYLKTDGNFNDAYRALVVYFAERRAQGMSLPEIKKEYNILYNKYTSKAGSTK